jgi:acyl dehydratase
VEILRSADDVRAAVGREMGPGEWFTVEQSRVDGFADDTEDHQWIHVDAERAAAGPFGGTIAHGFLTLSLVPHLANGVRRLENVAMGINYGLDKVRFPSPVRVGSRIRARAVILDVSDLAEGGLQVVTRITVELEGAAKPACVADMVSRTYFASTEA